MPTGGLAEWLVPLLWKTAASFAMNTITNKLFNKKSSNSPTYSMGALQTQCNSNMVMPIIYGRVQCAGNSLWQDGSGKTINRLVGFGIGRNRSVSEVKLNDMPLGIDYLFGIINTQYADATVRIYKSNSPTKNDKRLVLYANGIATNITLAGKGDSGSNGLEDYNCYTTKLYEHVNTLGNGWYMSDLVVDDDYDCEDMKELPLTSCYNAKIMLYNSNWDGLKDCSYTAYMGDGTQEIDSRVTGATQADKAKLVGGMKYDAYLAFTITASDKISGNPNVTAVWQGRIVKIYSTPTAYTQAWSNNVWCILDFMTSPDGCNIPVENIDVQSFIDAAAYAQPGDGTRDWQLNLILDEKKSRQDWLNEMLLCFRAYRTYQNGKHGLLIDKPEPVSQIFTVKPTESIEITWQELSEDTERIILKYPDPSYEWQNVGAPATMPPPFKNATYDGNGNVISNGVPLAKTIEIHGVTNFKQASQLSWFYLNQAQTCSEYVTYTCNKRALNRTIGDVIGIYDPITKRTEQGLAYKRYRIMAMTEPQGMSIQLYCREYNANLYNDTLGSIAPMVSVSKLPNRTTAPPAITNLTATEYGWAMANGAHVSNIDIAFSPSNYFDVVSYLVTLSEDGETWRYINTISDVNYRVENVANGNYFVGVQPVNKAGIVGTKGTVAVNVLGKDNAPNDVDTLMVETLASGVKRLSWAYTYPTPNDVAGFKLKYNLGNSIWWQTAIPLHSGLMLASPFETANLPSGTVTVMVVAVDNAGNESITPAYAIIGLGDTIVDNVLFEGDLKGIAWEGTKTNCHVYEDNLVADDSSDLMFPLDDNAAIYPVNIGDLFYTANWPEMTYQQETFVDSAGLLSFASSIDGNAQIYFRRQYPFLIYGADYDQFYPTDDTLMYKEGPWSTYAGKVEAVADNYQFKVIVPAGKTQGIVKTLTAVIDVPDKSETLNDIAISADGTRLPILKTYTRIKNVNVTLQDNGTTAISARCVSKDALGPIIILVDKNNAQVTGVIDVTIQGY